MASFVTANSRTGSKSIRCQPEIVYELREERLTRRRVLKVHAGNVWLTAREVTLLQAIAEGLESKQIAYRLGKSEKTVKNQLCHLYQEIEVPNRAAAAAFAVRHGIAS